MESQETTDCAPGNADNVRILNGGALACNGHGSQPLASSGNVLNTPEALLTLQPYQNARQHVLSTALAIPAEPSSWRSSTPPSLDLVHVPALQQAIIPFKFVEPGLDLNVAPENWLRGMHRLLEQRARQPNYFSSFPIADAVASSVSWQDAAVDIISHSRNIKRLLSSPVSRQSLNLIVHRIGQTLLVDDFDGVGSEWMHQQEPQAAGPREHAAASSIRLEQEQRQRFQAYLKANAASLALREDQGDGVNMSPVHASVSPPRNLITHQSNCDSVNKSASPDTKRKKNSSVQKRLALESKFIARSIADDSEHAPPSTSANGSVALHTLVRTSENIIRPGLIEEF